MNIKIKTLSLFAIFSALISAPAFATTANDLKQCKAAISADGNYAADAYSVKFRSTKGNSRSRTVKLQLQDKSSDEKFAVACKLRKGEVVDLQISPK